MSTFRNVPGMGGGSRGRGTLVVKPKDMRGTLRRLLELTRGNRQGLWIVFLLSALASLSSMFTPLLIGKVVDAVAAGNAAMALLALLACVYAGDWAIRFTQGYLMAAVSQRVVKGIRKSLFAVMKRLPLSFFDRNQHGDLMSRLTNDIDNISVTISDSLTQLMMLVFTVVGIFIVMLTLNLWLTLTALCTVPLVILLARSVTRRTRPLFKDQQRVLGRLGGHIEESVSGLMLVKAFGQEDEVTEVFSSYNRELCRVGTRALIWSGYLMPIMNVINNLGFILVSVISGLMAAEGMITVGVISSFLLYTRQFTRPFTDIANIYNVFQTAVAGAERVFEIFDQEPEPADAPNALAIHNPRGDIVFDHVSFGYDPQHPVIHDLSFTVPAGTRVAIVGSTGAGKTTIISLLARFYDVTGGAILLDGHDIRDYRRRDLRDCFGVVLQDSALFSMSVRENIRYGRQDASDAEVEAAARAAGAHGFISRLSQGYDTILEDGGGGLSQGERQLLTIARAILSDAPIMILDEATSSVDTRTEQKIRTAMHSLTSGRTSFLIAHRLSTIRDCDVIILLEHGRIAEMGNHETLMKLGGTYCAMYRTQLGWLEAEGTPSAESAAPV